MIGLGLFLLVIVAGVTWMGARLMRRKEAHAPLA